MREEELLGRVRELFARRDPGVAVGSGPDDCAHVASDGNRLAMTVDAFVEGSHFHAGAPPRGVARKSVGASLSDLAASGCRARWLLVALGLRPGLADGWPDEFARGLAEAADEWGVTVIGGDTVASPGGVVVSVTAVGEPLPGGPLLRRGARPGDILAVTGTLGGSILGRHLAPVPRLEEMRRLFEFALGPGGGVLPSAGMDISDGLALDLSRLCRESGTGAAVEAAAVPVSDAARELARRDGGSPLRHALSDGEDFELLVAFPPPLWERFAAYQAAVEPAGGGPARPFAPFTRIGGVTAGGLTLVGPDGRSLPLAPEGYEHQW